LAKSATAQGPMTSAYAARCSPSPSVFGQNAERGQSQLVGRSLRRRRPVQARGLASELGLEHGCDFERRSGLADAAFAHDQAHDIDERKWRQAVLDIERRGSELDARKRPGDAESDTRVTGLVGDGSRRALDELGRGAQLEQLQSEAGESSDGSVLHLGNTLIITSCGFANFWRQLRQRFDVEAHQLAGTSHTFDGFQHLDHE
jgi:hypothetical protein